MASGKIYALYCFVGLFIGSVLFSLSFIWIESFYNSTHLSGDDLSTVLSIQTSEDYSIGSFLEKKIAVNETIFLYSESEAAAVELYSLLNIRGYFKVKVLAGGVDAWFDQILQPKQASIEPSQLARRQKTSSFFGGTFDSSGDRLEVRKISIEKRHKKHQGC